MGYVSLGRLAWKSAHSKLQTSRNFLHTRAHTNARECAYAVLTTPKLRPSTESTVVRVIEKMLLSVLLKWENKLHLQVTITFPSYWDSCGRGIT